MYTGKLPAKWHSYWMGWESHYKLRLKPRVSCQWLVVNILYTEAHTKINMKKSLC